MSGAFTHICLYIEISSLCIYDSIFHRTLHKTSTSLITCCCCLFTLGLKSRALRELEVWLNQPSDGYQLMVTVPSAQTNGLCCVKMLSKPRKCELFAQIEGCTFPPAQCSLRFAANTNKGTNLLFETPQQWEWTSFLLGGVLPAGYRWEWHF